MTNLGELFMTSARVFSNIVVWVHTISLLVVSLLPDIVIDVVKNHWDKIVNKTRLKQKILDINDNRQIRRYTVSEQYNNKNNDI